MSTVFIRLQKPAIFKTGNGESGNGNGEWESAGNDRGIFGESPENLWGMTEQSSGNQRGMTGASAGNDRGICGEFVFWYK